MSTRGQYCIVSQRPRTLNRVSYQKGQRLTDAHLGEIRAEQRRQHGVPQWSLDNKDDRVFNLNPPKTADDALPKGRMPRRAKRS